jgi:hypothetical protein
MSGGNVGCLIAQNGPCTQAKLNSDQQDPSRRAAPEEQGQLAAQ